MATSIKYDKVKLTMLKGKSARIEKSDHQLKLTFKYYGHFMTMCSLVDHL